MPPLETTEAVYQSNLKCLKEHHRIVADSVENAPSLFCDVKVAEGQILNCYCENVNGDFVPVYPEAGPLTDMDDVLAAIKGKSGLANCFLGTGLCLHAKAALKYLDKNQMLFLFEANPAFLKKAMEISDLRDLFSDTRIRIATGNTVDIQSLFSDEDAKLFTSKGYQLIEFNSVMAFSPEWYAAIKGKIAQFFMKRNESTKVFEHAGHSLFENRFRNLFSMIHSDPIDVLKDRYKNCPIVIVASGPSLGKNIHELKNAKDAVLIAVDSAVGPLMNHDIIPDYIVTADFRDMTYEKLAPFAERIKESRLVFFADSTPKIPAYLSFKATYYLFVESPVVFLFKELLQRDVTPIPDAQSCIHGAIGLAQLMGANPIIFTGLDLAFKGDKDHVEGTVLNWGNKQGENKSTLSVPCVNGGTVRTLPGFIAQKEICEQLIALKPEITYIDASEGGAIIEGTRIMPLKSVVALNASEQTDLKSEFSNAPDVIEVEDIYDLMVKLQGQLDGFKKDVAVYFAAYDDVDRAIKKARWNTLKDIPDFIKNKIREMDAISTRLDNDKLIAALKDLTGKMYKNYIETTLDDETAKGQTGFVRRVATDIRQQKTVLEIRRETLSEFESILHPQVTFFSDLLKLEKDLSAKPDSSEMTIKKAAFLYEQDFLGPAEMIFIKLDDSPEALYYLGCIDIKKGKIEDGRKRFETFIEQNPDEVGKVERFIDSIIDRWMVHSNSKILSDIQFDRLIRLAPENERVVYLRQRVALASAKDSVRLNSLEVAEAALKSAWHETMIPDIEYVTLFAVLLSLSGNYEYLTGVIELASTLDEWQTERNAQYDKWISTLIRNQVKWPASGSIDGLCRWGSEGKENRILLQRIFFLQMSEYHWGLFNYDQSETFLSLSSQAFDFWAPVQNQIPDWYLIKAFHSRNSGENEAAVAEVEKALEIEGKTITSFAGEKVVECNREMLLCESGQRNEMISCLYDGLKTGFRLGWWSTLALKLLSENKEEEVRSLVAELPSISIHKNHIRYHEMLTELVRENNLIPVLKEFAGTGLSPLKAERLFYAWFLYERQSDMKIGSGFKNLIDDISRFVGCKDFPELNRLTLKIWEDDAIALNNLSPEDKIEVIKTWAPLLKWLPDWPTICADSVAGVDDLVSGLTILEESISVYPENNDLLRRYTLLLFKSGRTDDGIAVFNKLVTISPESVTVLREVGDQYYSDGDYPAALTIYEECLELIPGGIDLLFNIGEIYQLTGNEKAAAFAWETLLLHLPDHEMARAKLNGILSG